MPVHFHDSADLHDDPLHPDRRAQGGGAQYRHDAGDRCGFVRFPVAVRSEVYCICTCWRTDRHGSRIPAVQARFAGILPECAVSAGCRPASHRRRRGATDRGADDPVHALRHGSHPPQLCHGGAPRGKPYGTLRKELPAAASPHAMDPRDAVSGCIGYPDTSEALPVPDRFLYAWRSDFASGRESPVLPYEYQLSPV